MSRDLIGDVNVFQTRDILHWMQPRDGPNAATCRAEEVVQNPVIARKSVYEAARDDGPDLEPRLLRRCQRGTQQNDILHNAICFLLRELQHSIKDDARSEREPNKRDRSDAQVALHENVSQHTASRFGAIKGVTPRIVDQVPQFCQD